MTVLTKSNHHFKTAVNKIPLGVTSNFRYWGPEETLYVDRGKGGHIWDIDGNRYIDYRLGYGPAILGHSDDRVDSAVAEAIHLGTSFSLGTPLEERVADQIISACPGIEMVRFTNSGTESTMHALRLARAHTRREKFIMFEGQYHGLHDNVMFGTNVGGWPDAGSRHSPVVIPTSSGIPDALRSLVIILPYNDLERLEAIVKQEWHNLAAILVEPIMGNCGGIMPADGWLQGIRDLCDEYGIVMLMDEVKTGFRVAKGGAQELFGVQADLVTYAKAMGNGYGVAAFAGKREIMQHIGQGVSHGGTYVANRVAMAAANATLDILLHTDALDQVRNRGQQLQDAMTEILSRTGRPFVVNGHPSMFSVWFSEKAPREYREWVATDHALYDQVAHGLIERGVMPEPDSREPWFMCSAHTDQDIADTANALEDTVRAVMMKN